MATKSRRCRPACRIIHHGASLVLQIGQAPPPDLSSSHTLSMICMCVRPDIATRPQRLSYAGNGMRCYGRSGVTVRPSLRPSDGNAMRLLTDQALPPGLSSGHVSSAPLRTPRVCPSFFNLVGRTRAVS